VQAKLSNRAKFFLTQNLANNWSKFMTTFVAYRKLFPYSCPIAYNTAQTCQMAPKARAQKK
jgi:hypothetical protein